MNTQTRIDDVTEENKALTEMKDAKYRLDFGYGRAESIYIETENDTLLLITTQGVLQIELNKLRKWNQTDKLNKTWFKIKEVKK